MMDRTANCRMAVDCPHCGMETDVRFNALSASGTVPREVHECDECEQRFHTSATIDVAVQP